MIDLGGRRALVTGASSGIGLATALGLARAGAEVHGAARRLETRAQASHGLFIAHRADVTSPEQMASLVEEISPAGPLDVAVFSAGTNIPERQLEQLTPESWNMLLATNLSSAFNGLRAVLPAMRRPGGLALLVSCVLTAWPDASGPAYQAAKAGVMAMVRAAPASADAAARGPGWHLRIPGRPARPRARPRADSPPGRPPGAGANELGGGAMTFLWSGAGRPALCFKAHEHEKETRSDAAQR